jgi:hypothetical protein
MEMTNHINLKGNYITELHYCYGLNTWHALLISTFWPMTNERNVTTVADCDITIYIADNVTWLRNYNYLNT